MERIVDFGLSVYRSSMRKLKRKKPNKEFETMIMIIEKRKILIHGDRKNALYFAEILNSVNTVR